MRIPRGSLDGSEGLEALKKDVTDAEAAPGSTHLVYVLHDFYSPIDSEVRDFLAWLKPRAAIGTVVKTVGDVTAGEPAAGRGRGPDQTVPTGSTVHLDGSGSSDPNGDPLTYQWSQTGGPSVILASDTAVQAQVHRAARPGGTHIPSSGR